MAQDQKPQEPGDAAGRGWDILMANHQQTLKTEYGRLLREERAALQEAVNTETACWDGKGHKPVAPAEAEASL
jgi:hypothetical protein